MTMGMRMITKGTPTEVGATMRFLYTFGFETPGQLARNEANGWDDEASRSVVIVAESGEQARLWGRAVAEEFLKALLRRDDVSWGAGRYADGIEPVADSSCPEIPVIAVGEMPDMAQFTERFANGV
jgi:hypothetical protein